MRATARVNDGVRLAVVAQAPMSHLNAGTHSRAEKADYISNALAVRRAVDLMCSPPSRPTT